MSYSNEQQQEATKAKSHSGLTYTWRLWRHCCCRYGWYPLIVAPIVTIGCMLSLYSSGGCDFIRVNVGFTPSNEAWNESTAELGLFFYQSGEPETNKYREAFVEGCRRYTDEFHESFIEEDRTWQVARIMGYISAVSSVLATVTAWMFVVSPLPACFFWPGVLLPALMTSFLAEGSKFLFFDTSVCRNTVWFPSGADSLPRVANECSLGATSILAIAAGAIFFICLILVCLKAPERRTLEWQYGTDNDMGESDLESANGYGQSTRSYAGTDGYTEGPGDADVSGDLREENLINERLRNLDETEDKYAQRPTDPLDDELDDDKYNPTKPSSSGPVHDPPVSASRLNTVEKMELNTTAESDGMIAQFVEELNVSFRVDGKEKPEEESKPEEKETEEVSVQTNAFCQPSLLCGPETA